MPPMPIPEHAAVDIAAGPFISFGPARRTGAGTQPAESHVSVPVGPPPEVASSRRASTVDEYPVQLSKVQRPPLREQTLARTRLLDWLAAKIHHRVVFVVAEAGYGKTTLLADFSGRTRLRTLWYRLDPADRDWIVFLRHLVAAGREHDQRFAEATASLLQRSGSAGVTRHEVTEAFLRDVASLGDDGAAFVLDDFHAVDDSDDVRHIVGELIRRAPERVTFVLSSRRLPTVKVARLRAQGEVAELSTEDLRFSDTETEQLFRETYGHALERDVLDDLSSRTEGWAASLQLVQAAIRDRSEPEIRRFVRSLSGAEGDLHDYLAEEVIGDLPANLQDFLMRVSLLDSVEPTLAAAAAETSGEETAAHFAAAERIGVLGRRGRGADATRGFHPLVRDFLRARLARDAGDTVVRETHIRIAQAAEPLDWSVACSHYLAAHRPADVHRVVRASMHHILGSAAFAEATQYLDASGAPNSDSGFESLRARAEFRQGKRRQGLDRAKRAHSIDPQSEVALLNFVSLSVSAGEMRDLDALVTNAARASGDFNLQSIMSATAQLLRLSVDGNLGDFVSRATAMAVAQHESGLSHYEGISWLNAAIAARVQGNPEEARVLAARARAVLEVNSTIEEIVAARLVTVWAMAHTGEVDAFGNEMSDVLKSSDALTLPEALVELAKVQLWYGDTRDAESFIASARRGLELRPELRPQWYALSLELAIRQRDFPACDAILPTLMPGQLSTEVGFASHCLALYAFLAIARGANDVEDRVREAIDFAEKQGAWFWAKYVAMLAAISSAEIDGGFAISRLARSDPAYLSIFPREVVARLPHLSEDAHRAVAAEASLRAGRWRLPLREAVDRDDISANAAAFLLGEVGDQTDVPRLRQWAQSRTRNVGAKDVGRQLARRLAKTVYVEDLGRVSILVGGQPVPETQVRRKVLALICYLVSRPEFAATRDQVVDALWPDLEPDVALNSLNQTVYFLRRVLEPTYSEAVSPGYLVHDANVLWLDRELVDARSAECWRLVSASGVDGRDSVVDELASAYRGKFALDFAYEEWAIAYREPLHAAVLQIIETAIARDTAAGLYSRAIDLARRAIHFDPEADHIELALLRLYRLSGAHPAAAEQYAHYAAIQRSEYGVEPPALDMV
jgi:DNA-binding SARP family transcriptional activator